MKHNNVLHNIATLANSSIGKFTQVPTSLSVSENHQNQSIAKGRGKLRDQYSCKKLIVQCAQ